MEEESKEYRWETGYEKVRIDKDFYYFLWPVRSDPGIYLPI